MCYDFTVSTEKCLRRSSLQCGFTLSFIVLTPFSLGFSHIQKQMLLQDNCTTVYNMREENLIQKREFSRNALVQ